MGKEVRGVPQAPAVDRQASRDGEVGIGRYLAGQRRLRDVSLEGLAELTRIPLRSLERLEAGAFDAAPDGFVRGFVRTVAEALGLDPDEAVMRLQGEADAGGEAAEHRRRILRQRALFARAALVAGVVLAGVVVWKLVSLWMTPAAAPAAEERILRRDPVRALARENPLPVPTLPEAEASEAPE